MELGYIMRDMYILHILFLLTHCGYIEIIHIAIILLSDSYSSNGVLSCPIMLLAFTKSKSLQIHHTIS